MITVDSFFSGTLNTVDAVIGNFVQHAYANFIQANSSVITLLCTLYVMIIGYQFLSHHHHFHLGNVVKRLIVMLCVYGLLMNWDLYNIFVYNIFTNEPGNIAHTLITAANDGQSTESIFTTLDTIYSTIVQTSAGFFSEVSFSASGLAFIFYGSLVFIIGSLMCVFALL